MNKENNINTITKYKYMVIMNEEVWRMSGKLPTRFINCYNVFNIQE